MLSPPLSVHAKTEISTILFLPGKYFLFTSEASSQSHLSGFRLSGQTGCVIVDMLCAFSMRTTILVFLTAAGRNENCLATYSWWFLMLEFTSESFQKYWDYAQFWGKKRKKFVTWDFLEFYTQRKQPHLRCFLPSFTRVYQLKSPLVYFRKGEEPRSTLRHPHQSHINKCPGYLLLCLIFFIEFMVPIIPWPQLFFHCLVLEP